MTDIRITPALQRLLVLALLATIGAAVAAQGPEIKRYLKVASM